jgi:hypothetical protein
MRRFLTLLLHEFRLARSALPVHAVTIVEPAFMYALMTVILVHPTLDMNVQRPRDDPGRALLAAMDTVGSPIGLPYIRIILVDADGPIGMQQVIVVEEREGGPVAVQRFNLINENLVKNYRNRLTAAALRIWNAELGPRAVTIVEYPTRPMDIPYNVYFGMAMLPMAAFLAAAILGGVLTAQDFEFGTFLEQRLAPVRPELVLAARLTRIVLTALLGSGLVLLLIGWLNSRWPDSAAAVMLILLPVAVIGSCLGVMVGLTARKTIPAFLFGLIASFTGWILGAAFKPTVSIGGAFEFFSRFTPNRYAVELLFPRFYETEIASVPGAALVLSAAALVTILLAAFAYRRAVAPPR